MNPELDALNRRIKDAKSHLSDLYVQRRELKAIRPVIALRAKAVAMFQSGRSIEDIAAEMNRTPFTVRSWLEHVAYEEVSDKHPFQPKDTGNDAADWDRFDVWHAFSTVERNRLIAAWNPSANLRLRRKRREKAE